MPRIIVSRFVVTPMTRPQPWLTMWPTAARAIRKGPLTLTSTTRRHTSGGSSQNGGCSLSGSPA